MSHSTHEEKPIISSRSAMFFALIIVGLIVGTMNFVKAMSHSEGHGGGHGEHQTEAAHGAPAHGTPAAHGEGQGHEATGHEATATHENAADHHDAKDGDTATMAEKAGDHGQAEKH